MPQILLPEPTCRFLSAHRVLSLLSAACCVLPASQFSAVAGFHRAVRDLRRAASAARGAVEGEAARREAPAAATAQAVPHRAPAALCTRSWGAIREFALFPITFDSIDSRQMTDTAAADHAVPVRLRRLSIGPDDDARARARGATSMIAVRSQAHVPRQALSGAPCPVSCRLECRVNRPARTRSRSVDGGGRAGLAGDCTRHATAVVK